MSLGGVPNTGSRGTHVVSAPTLEYPPSNQVPPRRPSRQPCRLFLVFTGNSFLECPPRNTIPTGLVSRPDQSVSVVNCAARVIPLGPGHITQPHRTLLSTWDSINSSRLSFFSRRFSIHFYHTYQPPSPGPRPLGCPNPRIGPPTSTPSHPILVIPHRREPGS